MITMLLLIYVILVSSGSSTANIVDVALSAASKNFNPRRITLVSWRNDAPSEATQFLASYCSSVLIVELADSHASRACHQHVLFATHTEDYPTFLVMIKPDQVEPIKVIVVLLVGNVDEDKLLSITKASWEADVSDLAVVTRDGKGRVKVTTYFPNNSQRCQDYRPVTRDASDVAEFFPEKFRNFHGCPLRVSLIEHAPFNIFTNSNGIFKIDGIEGNFVTLLSDILNSTLVPVFPAQKSFGVLRDGVWTGIMADLVYNRADISASSAIFTVERFKAVQVTHAYKTLDLVWCLPRVSRSRGWARVLLPLVSCTTALVCLTAAVFLSVAALFNKIADRKCKEQAPKLSVLQTCAVFLGQPVRWARAGGVLGQLFALWLWFCLVLRIVYQGELVRSLERGAAPPRVATLARALQLVDQYGGADSVATFYRNTTILKKFKVLRLEEVHPMLADIGRGRRFLLAVDRWSVLQSGAAVAVVGERVARAPVGVLARARWAGARALRAAVARAVRAGLYRRLVADYIWRHLLLAAPAADLTYSALTLHHLSGCFFILLIAAFMCFLVFLAEILWFLFKQRAKEKNIDHVLLPFVH